MKSNFPVKFQIEVGLLNYLDWMVTTVSDMGHIVDDQKSTDVDYQVIQLTPSAGTVTVSADGQWVAFNLNQTHCRTLVRHTPTSSRGLESPNYYYNEGTVRVQPLSKVLEFDKPTPWRRHLPLGPRQACMIHASFSGDILAPVDGYYCIYTHNGRRYLGVRPQQLNQRTIISIVASWSAKKWKAVDVEHNYHGYPCFCVQYTLDAFDDLPDGCFWSEIMYIQKGRLIQRVARQEISFGLLDRNGQPVPAASIFDEADFTEAGEIADFWQTAKDHIAGDQFPDLQSDMQIDQEDAKTLIVRRQFYCPQTNSVTISSTDSGEDIGGLVSTLIPDAVQRNLRFKHDVSMVRKDQRQVKPKLRLEEDDHRSNTRYEQRGSDSQRLR